MNVLVLADDLTGAADVGGRCAARGVRSVVELGGRPAGATVRIVNTESRHLSPAEAAERVREALGGRRSSTLVLKKTDSTLRGNLGPELMAVLRATQAEALIFFPAYPAAGRTVFAGELRVHGVPVAKTAYGRGTPGGVTISHVGDLLASQGVSELRLATSGAVDVALELGGLIVADGTTLEEEAEIAARVLARGLPAAGPAGFLGAILARLELPTELTPPEDPDLPRLVVCGSLNPVSADQIRRAIRSGAVELDLFAAPADHAETAVAALADGRDVILRPPRRGRRLTSDDVLAAAAAWARAVVPTVPAELLLTGGDTAAAALCALGVLRLWPLAELCPGAVRSRPEPAGAFVRVVTKSGGFGPPDLLVRSSPCVSA